ncbi:uncharacterized protein LOC128080241 [Tympanuchus pallidicinctus]|uniref:uncharacterized protein LOC128080241 n=1 Tax=Tympanuchus pallidicinctus TaxID=109042 RepID=UPI0022873AAC|nr:uncharacterized protein LOC128080241 [Tympanuchus pallidicinctus]
MPLRGARGGARGALTPSGPAGPSGTGRPRRVRAARRGLPGARRSRTEGESESDAHGTRLQREGVPRTAPRGSGDGVGARRAAGTDEQRSRPKIKGENTECLSGRSLLHRPDINSSEGKRAGPNISEVTSNLCAEAPELRRTCRRIIESFELEEALKGHLAQLPYNKQEHLQLHQVLAASSSLNLSASRSRILLGLSITLQCPRFFSRQTRSHKPRSLLRLCRRRLGDGNCTNGAPGRSGCRLGGAASWLHLVCATNECQRAPCSSLLLRENLVCFYLYFLNAAQLFPR